MSIKQGEYLKQLRVENKFSQEQLGEKLGLSRQSISKWEQGLSTPDVDNFVKLSQLYNVPIEALLKGEPCESIENIQDDQTNSENDIQNPENHSPKRSSWLLPSYPILAVIAYAIVGTIFKGQGWGKGWLILLTIPLFYTGVAAYKHKKTVIFCYPVLVLIIFLFFGLFFDLWHPLWIIFLTIPIFYIVTGRKKK